MGYAHAGGSLALWAGFVGCDKNMEINEGAIAQRSRCVLIRRATDLAAATAHIFFRADHGIRMLASRPLALPVR